MRPYEVMIIFDADLDEEIIRAPNYKIRVRMWIRFPEN